MKKKAIQWIEKEHQREYDNRYEEISYKAYKLNEAIAEKRKQNAIANAQFNKLSHEQHIAQNKNDKLLDTNQKLEEISNQINSSFLKETIGEYRGRKTQSQTYKGLTVEEKNNAYRLQLQQRNTEAQEKIKKKDEEHQIDQKLLMETSHGHTT